ncbi:MAG: hypothetical protein U1F83_19775 [Verrucomicrobiota bacterium]
MRPKASVAIPPTTCRSHHGRDGHHSASAAVHQKTGEKIKIDTRTGKYMERA